MRALFARLARVATIASFLVLATGFIGPAAVASVLEVQTAGVELEAVRRAPAGAEGEAFLRLRIDDEDSTLRVRASAEGLDEFERYSLCLPAATARFQHSRRLDGGFWLPAIVRSRRA